MGDDRVEEALGFARAGAGTHERGFLVVDRTDGFLLVPVALITGAGDAAPLAGALCPWLRGLLINWLVRFSFDSRICPTSFSTRPLNESQMAVVSQCAAVMPM